MVDSTPAECGRSRPTVKRSELAGWAKYGFCRSHSRWFWGLRLHLVCTPAGLPIAWALADPKVDERQVIMAICDHEPHLLTDRPSLLIIADEGYVSAELDRFLAERRVTHYSSGPVYRPHLTKTPKKPHIGHAIPTPAKLWTTTPQPPGGA
ncbi:transposase [Amycolatopsis sp. Hca4]|uniref:transposase n=1 Tax=Amycolatopsis sp. Hca4 TaxID=2742131 RepID=UPI0020CAC27B|nr:transposase [Amycolatopsis sp. Hca4]